jgi:uncharacterized membrane protein
MLSDPVAFGVLLAMAALVYANRAGGYWLMGRVRITPFVSSWLGHVPGAALIALLARDVASGGPAEWATLAIAFAMVRAGVNDALAIGAAVAALAGMRAAGL